MTRTGDRHRLPDRERRPGRKRSAHDSRPRPERRKGGARARTGQARSRVRRLDELPTIGVDGEAVALGEGRGLYVLMGAADSDGTTWATQRAGGLGTRACFDFLLDLPRGIKFGFGFSYDVNMMLGDVPPGLLRQLHDTGRVYVGRYRIEWVGGRKFTVAERETAQRGAKVLRSATVWDILPWQHSSFVRWLEEWELAPVEELERIRTMKDLRADFAPEDLADIRRYCLAECTYLAAGARRLVDLTDRAGLTPRVWYSPASLAKQAAKTHRLRTRAGHDMDTIAERAFYGGRAEVTQTGPVAGPLWTYDIRSAYPAAAIGLPCLVHGEWVERGPVADPPPHSLCYVRWRPLKGTHRPTWGPFPVRSRASDSLKFPTHGAGWYWGVEVAAAARHAQVTVVECHAWVPSCRHRPFKYLDAIYRQRATLKGRGDPAEYVLKLVMNSTYGMLAEHPHGPRTPAERCLCWAGMICATTRARLLEVLDDDVVMVATDGLLSRVARGGLRVSDRLGAWEAERVDEAFIAGSGLYWTRSGDEWTARTRGLESRWVDRMAFVDAWEAGGREGTVSVPLRRFMGLGIAFARIGGLEDHWRRFVDMTKVHRLGSEPRRTYLSTDPFDGRTRAPTAGELRSAEAIDREAAAKRKAAAMALKVVWRRDPSRLPVDVVEFVTLLQSTGELEGFAIHSEPANAIGQLIANGEARDGP